MNEPRNLRSVVKGIVDENQYMTLATADEDGAAMGYGVMPHPLAFSPQKAGVIA